jgi:ribose transport system substrate-binding protein
MNHRLARLAPALLIAVLLAGLVTGLCGCSGEHGAAPAAGGGHKLSLAVIPKGTTHVFWKSVEAGAQQAAGELGVDVIWKGPLNEGDRAAQIQLVQQFVAQKVDGIALAPLDHTALVAPVREALAAKLPVVIFDSALDGSAGHDFASFIATNNQQGGRLAGECLAKLLDGAGNVVLLRYVVGSASTAERETGFLAVVAEHAAMKVLVDNRYAGATAGEAKTEALNMMDQIRGARGVFCSNESATNGMLLALRQVGLAGKIRFVGFDASPPLVEALASGEIDALVVQNPRRMGYLAVTTLVAAIKGDKVEPSIDTGAVLVTRENMAQPEIAKLLQ